MSKSEHEYLYGGDKYPSLRKLSEAIGKTVTSKNYAEFGIERIGVNIETDLGVDLPQKDKEPSEQGKQTSNTEQRAIDTQTPEDEAEEIATIEDEKYTFNKFKKYLSDMDDKELYHPVKAWGVDVKAYEKIEHKGIRRMRVCMAIQAKFFSRDTILRNQNGKGNVGNGAPKNPKSGIWTAFSNEELENLCAEKKIESIHLTGNGENHKKIQRMRLIQALNKNDVEPPISK